jgi:hypothetical protein
VIGDERELLLEEELLLVRHSGEIPEVALHGSLHFLCSDREGPCLALTHGELRLFEEAALTRYLEIIRRDLNPANRDLPAFRGIRRAISNWRRLTGFCAKIGVDSESFQVEMGSLLIGYVYHEDREVRAGDRIPSVNCTASALCGFVEALALDKALLPAGWEQLCLPADPSTAPVL